MPLDRANIGTHIVALVDDEFERKLDDRPTLLRQDDGQREWLNAGPLSVASIATEDPPPCAESCGLWKGYRLNACSKIRPPAIHALQRATNVSLLVHSGGGRVDLGKILCHFADVMNKQADVCAFVGNAHSAAADLLTHVPAWTMLKQGSFLMHHCARERAEIRQTIVGLAEYLATKDRGRWLRRVSRHVERPMTPAEQREWRERHRTEAVEFHAFVERTIRINDVRVFVHRLINEMLAEPFDTELLWTGDELKNLLCVRNVRQLCTTTTSLARAFEEHTGVSLDVPDMAPVRGFFERVGMDVHQA